MPIPTVGWIGNPGGGAVAAASHATKAGTRVLINTSPEPFTNWTASVTEDLGVLGGLLLAVNLAVIAFCDIGDLCGKLFTSRVRLYPSIPLGQLAIADGLVIDGVHRVAAARLLGLARIDASFFDGERDDVQLELQWRASGLLQLVLELERNDVRLPEGDRVLSTLDTLKVRTRDGLVPLSNFITREPVAQLAQINRIEQKRFFDVKAGVAADLDTHRFDHLDVGVEALVGQPVGGYAPARHAARFVHRIEDGDGVSLEG